MNTGAFDPFPAIGEWARRHQAWMHVDGAFGLWALTDPSRSHLTADLAEADSWATDGHKWLNVPYDCGIALVRRPGDLRRSFTAAAGYLPPGTGFEAANLTPQSSQRARQVEVWAVLRTLGRAGVTDLITRSCRHARTMAAYLSQAGLEVLNARSNGTCARSSSSSASAPAASCAPRWIISGRTARRPRPGSGCCRRPPARRTRSAAGAPDRGPLCRW